MTRPDELTEDERQAYWDAAMTLTPHTHTFPHATLRGRFPQLRGYMRPWRRWAAAMWARAFSAMVCGGETRRWEE